MKGLEMILRYNQLINAILIFIIIDKLTSIVLPSRKYCEKIKFPNLKQILLLKYYDLK